jgi:hypothetical protein
LENIDTVFKEIVALRIDLGVREPAVREKTAEAAFQSEFYNGIENILKRISHFYRISLPMMMFLYDSKPSFMSGWKH